MPGLIHPESLEMWNEWARSRDRLRRAKHGVTGGARTLARRVRGSRSGVPPAEGDAVDSATWTLHSREGAAEGRVLIAVDSASPTSRASLLTSLPYLRGGVDVLAPTGLEFVELSGEDWVRAPLADPAGAASEQTRAVLSIGQHLAAGAAAHALAQHRAIPEYVVQHGAITPFAPPLPRDVTLLSWSDADGEFWRSRRADVSYVNVGSQLLWQAAHEELAETSGQDSERPVFLGQLHGAELPRRITGGAAVSFCRNYGGLYRPHPSEVDVLSRAQHRLWKRRGIEFASTDVPLRELANPVVAVFSTGVLEAAARGRSAWVYCPSAPGWVREFWDRYGMRYLGGEPTPAPVPLNEEPAARIARLLEEVL